MLVVGLTGGVGSGKTTVARILKEEGAHLIDADEVARRIVEPRTPAWREIRKTFGDGILDKGGGIDRKRLASLVFSDSEAREHLNRIVHPRIKEEIGNCLKAIAEKDPQAIVIIDAPLLVETGEYRKMDRLIVVRSTEAQQIERLKQRSGLEEEEVRAIFASQAPLGEKLKLAHFVICNEASIEETVRRTKEVFLELRKIVSQRKEESGKRGGIEEKT